MVGLERAPVVGAFWVVVSVFRRSVFGVGCCSGGHKAPLLGCVHFLTFHLLYRLVIQTRHGEARA